MPAEESEMSTASAPLDRDGGLSSASVALLGFTGRAAVRLVHLGLTIQTRHS
jgi:hypothetical protein